MHVWLLVAFHMHSVPQTSFQWFKSTFFKISWTYFFLDICGMNFKITSLVHLHLKKGIWHGRLQTHSGLFFFPSRAESIIDDTLCVIWKGCVIQCQQERGFSVQRAPTRSSGITLFLWLLQPENSTTAQGVAKMYAWGRAHSPTQMHKHGMGQFRARRWTAVHLAKCWWPFLHSPSN